LLIYVGLHCLHVFRHALSDSALRVRKRAELKKLDSNSIIGIRK
jgi:hypothetical protein